MTIAVISWVFKQEIKPSSLKFVLVALADCSDDKGICWPSIEHIAEVTCQDRKTVIKSLDDLEARGWLSDTGKRMGRTNQVKVYRIDAYLDATATKPCVKGAENGTVPKQSQISVERVPIFPAKSTENGNPPIPPYRDDPSLEPLREPSEEANPSVDHALAKDIFRKLEAFFNSSTAYIMAPVYAWLRWGADYEMDILPAAERHMKRKNNPPGALSWLDEDINKSIAQRQKSRPELPAKNATMNNSCAKEPPIERTPEEQAEYDTKMRAWYCGKGFQHPKYNPEGAKHREVNA